MTTKGLKRRADRIVSALAILRDGRCTTCGTHTGDLQPGHYFHRTRQSVRWVAINVACQCASCNAAHNNDPEPLRRVIVQMIGEDGLESLERVSNQPLEQPDMDQIISELQHLVRLLPRYRKLSYQLQKKVIGGKFTNKELIHAIQGRSL